MYRWSVSGRVTLQRKYEKVRDKKQFLAEKHKVLAGRKGRKRFTAHSHEGRIKF